MKKNRTMRVATLLLALTLITSCFVGGTFAKYTTSTTGSDSARVAYWGFKNDAELKIDLFATEYDGKVKSSSVDNVVAPGTSKETTFAFGYVENTGKSIKAPEVDYTFKVDVTADGSYEDLDDNPNFKWTLGEEEYNTVDALIVAIEALAGTAATNGELEYKAGTLPDAFKDADTTHTIGWEWKFETEDDGMAAQDETDTAMGNAAELDNVTITIAISATQLD